MTATPFLLCVFGKNDVLLAMPFIVLLSFTSLVSTTRLSDCIRCWTHFAPPSFFAKP
jgi:hypothetical protein